MASSILQNANVLFMQWILTFRLILWFMSVWYKTGFGRSLMSHQDDSRGPNTNGIFKCKYNKSIFGSIPNFKQLF